MKKQLLLPVVFFLLAAGSLTAQAIYPVTVAPQVTPPTPLYLSSLADAGYSSYNPLRVQLLLNDLSIPNRQVRLKIYIEGNGYAAQSRDFVAGASPLELNSGVPLQLTHPDLAPYFNFQNLAGISPAQYAQPLPEGVYQFCFEVYDVLTGARLSAKSCANTVIFRNQPPLLVAPARGVVVQEQNPPFIIFQWTPRHLNVSNVEYELSLVEVWDAGVDPQGAFLASPPLFTATTRTTSYVYGPADPMLLTGKTYAWRVRAKALVGADEVGLFVNNGYSEVFHFRYVAPCAAPQQVAVQQVSASMATVGWWSDGQHLDFTVQYREKGSAQWYDGVTPREFFTLNGLKPETTYQFKVGGNCEGDVTTYSPVYEFTTLSREEAGYQGCNIDIVATPVANQQPLALLFVNDVIRAADFPVTVTQVEKNTPPFKGKGYTLIPWLQDTKIAVEFTNITVNTDNQLISGEIKTTYDPAWGNVVALESVVQDIRDLFRLLTQLGTLYDTIEETRETLTQEQWQEIDQDVETIFEAVETELNELLANGVITQAEAAQFTEQLEEAAGNYGKGGSACEGQGPDCNEPLHASETTLTAVVNELNAIKARSTEIGADSYATYCPDCNLITTPSGELMYIANSHTAYDIKNEPVIDSKEIVFRIFAYRDTSENKSENREYYWDPFLNGYYNEDGKKYSNPNKSWYDGIILGLAEIGKAEIDPKTYEDALMSMIKFGICIMIGGNCADDLDISLDDEDYKRLYAQFKELQGTEWVKFMTKLTYGAIIGYSTRVVMIQGKKWVRVGRWMSQAEYDKILRQGKLQPSSNDMTHVLLEGPDGFHPPKGSLYVEFDIPADTFIGQGGDNGWGIIFGENSIHGKFYISKGKNIGMPEVKNVQIINTKD